MGFKPILRIWLFGAVLPSKNDQKDKGADGGLKIIFFLKFFFILFCITKLLYKTLGPMWKLKKSQKLAIKSPPYLKIDRKINMFYMGNFGFENLGNAFYLFWSYDFQI